MAKGQELRQRRDKQLDVMCDYCGCRSEPEIAALSADHEHMLALTAQLRRAHAMGDDASGLIAELVGALGPHALREELGIFAALVTEGVDADYVAVFERDHVIIHELLSRDDAPSQALRIVELLEDHILREESDLFPAAHQMLGSEAWASIAASDHHGDHDHGGHDHGDPGDESRRGHAPPADDSTG